MIVKADVRPIKSESAKNLLAEASITFRSDLGDLTINKVRLVKGNGDDPFLSFPQETYDDKKGIKQYKKLVYLSKDLAQMALEAVLSGWSEALKKVGKVAA